MSLHLYIELSDEPDEWARALSVTDAAEGICRENGEVWNLLDAEGRERYERLAIAALEAVGAERG